MADLDKRESWGSRWGLILAAAGNAIGIGNLLRFPGQAAQNGGGAFMIPYVVSLLLFGLPMMWVAWTVGRMGGRFGHGSAPGMFERLWRHPAAKYLGVMGIAIPLTFCFYYTYIESWCLSYSWFSATGDYLSTPERTVHLKQYLEEFLGNSSNHSYFPGFTAAFAFAVITIALNVWILHRGVARGIELLAKIAMPLLFLFCLVLVVRVFTLGEIRGTVWDGLRFMWTPDFGALSNPTVWMAAAGQIFFTLSIGFGSLECYASYLKDNDDVALTGLTTTATNEFVEVIFGSLIAIPACAVFFGAAEVPDIAEGGIFAIGMISMPEILRSLPGLELFGTIWFLLLFFAAFTSSVAVAQPVMAFLQDEAKLPRGSAAGVVGLFWFFGTVPLVFLGRYGLVDEMDFWAGTVGLVVFAIVEAVLFSWVFGIVRGWNELHRGSLIRVPTFFKHVLAYVTPVLLVAILAGWLVDAVGEGSLIPSPKVGYEVAEIHRFPGHFGARAVATTGEDERAKLAEESRRLRDAIAAEVERVRRDLSAWADVAIRPDGSLAVLAVQGDPEMVRLLDPRTFQRWLEADGFRYEAAMEESAGGAGPPGPTRIRIHGLHRAPYIWFVRLLLAFVTLTFLMMIHTLWRRRGEGREDPESGAAGAGGGAADGCPREVPA